MLLSFFWNLFIIKLEIPNTVFILKKHVQWQVSCDAVQGVRIRAVNLPSLKFENPKNQRNVASDQNCEDCPNWQQISSGLGNSQVSEVLAGQRTKTQDNKAVQRKEVGA